MSLVRFVFATLGASTMLAACSDSPPAPSRVLLQSFIGPGQNGAAVCQLSSEDWVDIANQGASVDNGGTDGTGAGVGVTCSVTSVGDGTFNVLATASLQGTRGGSVTISGKLGPTGQQTNVQGVFIRGDTGQFAESDCTVDYTAAGMGIAAGRVWGSLNCPKATKPDANPPRICAATATFKFENCVAQ